MVIATFQSRSSLYFCCDDLIYLSASCRIVVTWNRSLALKAGDVIAFTSVGKTVGLLRDLCPRTSRDKMWPQGVIIIDRCNCTLYTYVNGCPYMIDSL